MGIRDIYREILQSPKYGYIGPDKPGVAPKGMHFPAGASLPDYKLYVIEDKPELMEVQKKLAARGLKSPWLRNSAWRYDRTLWGSERWRIYEFVTMGWRVAIPMLIVTALYEFKFKEDDHHGHGGGHGHGKAHH